VIQKDGLDFSNGERQRLCLASALAKNPALLILDEATSALDAKTEDEVMRAIRSRDISLVIAAHRLSTIRDCDEIIVLDHGRVVERGGHDALMAKGGFYARLIANG
jgi:ABC-type multidrug transport system fused ATPase/permease subunit